MLCGLRKPHGFSLNDCLVLYKNLFVLLSGSQVVLDGDPALPCFCSPLPPIVLALLLGSGLQDLPLNGPFILTTEAKQSSCLIISKFHNYQNLSMT